MDQEPYTVYNKVQLLSLDIVAGAVGGGVMAAEVLQVTLPDIWWVVFPIAVWVLYTSDHLLDARRLGDQATTDRHIFHVVHYRSIFTVWILLLVGCIVVVPWFVPRRYIFLALLTGGISVIHFGLVWLVKDKVTPWLAKEAGVALVYTAGVWGGALVLLNGLPTWSAMLLILQFFFLALINLLTFGIYEELSDQLNGFTSWARGMGRQMSRFMLLIMAGFCLLCEGIILFNHHFVSDIWMAACTQFVMLGVLMWVAFDTNRFSPRERYRAVADAAFLIPLSWIPGYLTTTYGHFDFWI